VSTMNYTGTLTVVDCTCGIVFAIPEALDRQARDRKKSIYCPLGHSWHYTESTVEKLERERREHRATRDLLHAEERSHAGTRGALTKAKKQVHRAEHGVCPHCNRSFVNLQRHVQTKHPECLA
jgi:hypothetical protein